MLNTVKTNGISVQSFEHQRHSILYIRQRKKGKRKIEINCGRKKHTIACCHYSCPHFIYRLLTRRDCGRRNRRVIKVIKSLQPIRSYFHTLTDLRFILYTFSFVLFHPPLLLTYSLYFIANNTLSLSLSLSFFFFFWQSRT